VLRAKCDILPKTRCMNSDRQASSTRVGAAAALVVILAAAAAARLWYMTSGVPHAVGIDEPQVIDRAIRILRTGDWNPHIFDYPTLVIYFHAIVAIVRFLWGALNGEWASLDGFTVTAIYTAGRFAAAMIGVLTVWLTYKLAAELSSRSVALLAAALLAVVPIHVRESHFILTDVPMTGLTTLSVWLAVRAGRLGTVRAYAIAGAACGLAAAAKYNGGVAIVAVAAAWLIHERTKPDRLTKAGAIAGAAALAFLIGAPYTVLDMQAFLNGFAAQFSRFASAVPGPDPAWMLYVKHLAPASARFTVPLALLGVGVVLWRAPARWLPAVTFTFAYFYVLSSHSPVFGRYALPLVPLLCVFIAVASLEIVALLQRVRPLARPALQPLLALALAALLLWPMAAETIRWLDRHKRADTRAIAVDWLKSNTPKGTRVAVENSGPTYLDTHGFKVAGTQMLIDHPLDWYRSRADYLVISTVDLARYGDYVGAGPTVFQVSPTPQRWGPPILIVKIGTP
jgi:4-amino-4-deoxy-L-arabinose transferase-like glycosyltransferase